MSNNHQPNSARDDDAALFLIIFALCVWVACVWAINKWPKEVLENIWLPLRTVEMVFILRFDVIYRAWTHNWTHFGTAYNYINNLIWTWISIPAGVYICLRGAYHQLYMSHERNWSMEHTMISYANRFAWLKEIVTVDFRFGFIGKWPFYRAEPELHYRNQEFVQGEQALDFYEKHRANLEETLKAQVGPKLTLKNGRIQWVDPVCKRIAEELFFNLKKRNTEKIKYDLPAWQECAQAHQYERTFVLGLFSKARAMGVLSAARFLWLRTEATRRLRENNDPSAFYLWRAMVSAGGLPHPENAGLLNQMLMERGFFLWAQEYPEDQPICQTLAGSLTVSHAIAGFQELHEKANASTIRKYFTLE